MMSFLEWLQFHGLMIVIAKVQYTTFWKICVRMAVRSRTQRPVIRLSTVLCWQLQWSLCWQSADGSSHIDTSSTLRKDSRLVPQCLADECLDWTQGLLLLGKSSIKLAISQDPDLKIIVKVQNFLKTANIKNLCTMLWRWKIKWTLPEFTWG